LLNLNNDNNEQQEILDKAFFSYVGYHHVQNLNQDLDSNREEINKMNTPKSLDEWFYKFNSDINNTKRKNRNWSIFKNITNKAAIIFLVVAISMTVLTVSVDAFRARVFNLIIESTERYLGIKVEEDKSIEDNSYNEIKGYYVPGYIPEGFELDSIEEFGKTVIITFTNENSQKILFDQSPNGTSYQLDSEDAVKEDVEINGEEGIALIKGDFIALFWNNEESSFYVLSDIELEEMIKMAESLEKNK